MCTQCYMVPIEEPRDKTSYPYVYEYILVNTKYGMIVTRIRVFIMRLKISNLDIA